MGLLRWVHRYLVRQTMPDFAVRYYDELISPIAPFYLGPFRDEILRSLPGPATILDIGTGPGHLPVLLAQANPSYRIVGVDLSEESLRVGRRRAATAGVANRVAFIRVDVQKDGYDLPLADLAVSTCSLHHWRHPAGILRSVSQLVKPSGEIWILDDWRETSDNARQKWIARVESAVGPRRLFRTVFRFESQYLAYDRRELDRLCEKAGLRLVAFDVADVFFLARIVSEKVHQPEFLL